MSKKKKPEKSISPIHCVHPKMRNWGVHFLNQFLEDETFSSYFLIMTKSMYKFLEAKNKILKTCKNHQN